jgi:hypothetical protein
MQVSFGLSLSNCVAPSHRPRSFCVVHCPPGHLGQVIGTFARARDYPLQLLLCQPLLSSRQDVRTTTRTHYGATQDIRSQHDDSFDRQNRWQPQSHGRSPTFRGNATCSNYTNQQGTGASCQFGVRSAGSYTDRVDNLGVS